MKHIFSEVVPLFYQLNKCVGTDVQIDSVESTRFDEGRFEGVEVDCDFEDGAVHIVRVLYPILSKKE